MSFLLKQFHYFNKLFQKLYYFTYIMILLYVKQFHYFRKNIRSAQKFLPIFVIFFITIKKWIQYKLIEAFSTFSHLSEIHPLLRLQVVWNVLCHISKSFLNRLNQFAHVH